MIKAIAFDIGGVIVGAYAKQLVQTFKEEQQLPVNTFVSRNNELESPVQRGEESMEAYWRRVATACGAPEKATELMHTATRIFDHYTRPNPETIAIARALHNQGFIVGCLSNTTHEHVAKHHKHRIYDNFNPVILSCEVGTRKPEARIYQLFTEQTRTRPEETILIDDSPAWIAAAEAQGWHAILYTDANKLKEDLQVYGINV
jgi:putative hydrolase of the HAD superfamily